MVFWDLIFDLLLTTFSHFAGTDFSLVFNVLVYHVLNEKNYPRGARSEPSEAHFRPRCIKITKSETYDSAREVSRKTRLETPL